MCLCCVTKKVDRGSIRGATKGIVSFLVTCNDAIIADKAHWSNGASEGGQNCLQLLMYLF